MASNQEKFEKNANELLKNWNDYNILKRKIELLDKKCKDYMIENKIDSHENEYGKLVLMEQYRNVLDRSLIEDIEKYYNRVKCQLLYKVLKIE